MTTWQRFYSRLVTAIDVQPTVPPDGIIPGFPTLDDTPEAAELEQQARTRHMLRHVQRTLLLESLTDPGHRNQALIDFCLESRLILQPSPPDPQALREVPPVGIRYPVPVIPGGAS